jgi:hypothetical protein
MGVRISSPLHPDGLTACLNRECHRHATVLLLLRRHRVPLARRLRSLAATRCDALVRWYCGAVAVARLPRSGA